jgi:alcohol dehydrogenase/L-iditol 2-dehydrogenase
VGWGHEPCGFSLDPIVAKAVRIQGTYSHNWRTWERVLGLLAAGRIRVAPLRGVFPLDHWREAFETMDSLTVAKSVLVP